MKKKNKRNMTKYPGLDNTVNLRIRKDYMDIDYADKLSPEDKLVA